LYDDTHNPKVIFLDKLVVLLAEHNIEEALLTLEAGEKKYLTIDEPRKESNVEISAFKVALFKRKSILEDQLVRYFEQPPFSVTQLRRSLSGLIKIGKSSLAHQVLLKVYGVCLQKSVEAFLPTCSICTETYSATLPESIFALHSTCICIQTSKLVSPTVLVLNHMV
jgi:exocyst complex component 8